MKFDFATLDKPFEANWPVKVPVAQDGGAVQEQTFTARFRMLPRNRLNELFNREPPEDKTVILDPIGDWLKEAVVSVAEESDVDAAMAALLKWPHTTKALQDAYNHFAQGVAVKN